MVLLFWGGGGGGGGEGWSKEELCCTDAISCTSPKSCIAGHHHFRNSRVSASEVKPQGNKLWDTVDEIETEQAPGMRLHSPSYPAANGLWLFRIQTLTSPGKVIGFSLQDVYNLKFLSVDFSLW